MLKDRSEPAGTDIELSPIALRNDSLVEDLGEILDIDQVSALLGIAPDFDRLALDGAVDDITVGYGPALAVHEVSFVWMEAVNVGKTENEALQAVHLTVMLYEFTGADFADGIDRMVGGVVELRRHISRKEILAFFQISVVVGDGLHEKETVNADMTGIFQDVQGSLYVGVDVFLRMISFHTGGKHSREVDNGINVFFGKFAETVGIFHVAAIVFNPAFGEVIRGAPAGGGDFIDVGIEILGKIVHGVNTGLASGAEY